MEFLQRFFAIIITVLSIAIVFMVLASNEKTSGYVSFITDLFSENESDNIRLLTGNFEPIQGNGDQIEDSEVEALDDSGIDGFGYSFAIFWNAELKGTGTVCTDLRQCAGS